MKLDPYLSTIKKINSKTDWKLICKTWNHESARRKHRGNASGYWNGWGFLDETLKAQAIKAKVDKWGPIKVKSFCTAKEVRRPTEWENICKVYCVSDKGSISRKYKEPQNSIA
jgi:hypothetical protein